MFLEMLSLGVSSLISREVFSPSRKEIVSSVVIAPYAVPVLPPVHIGTMMDSAMNLSRDAWKVFGAISEEARKKAELSIG
jgi:hypothetical protein